MGIILGIIAFLVTILLAGLQLLATGMSDAPSMEQTPVWPTFLVGFGLSFLLIGSHFFPIGW